MRHLFYSLIAMAAALPAAAAVPEDGGINFQPAATRIAERVHFFHDFLLWIIVPITIFVTALLIWVMVRYNRRANPNPSKFSHNTAIEILWTTIPALILVAIAGLSFPNLYYQDVAPDLEEVQRLAAEYSSEGNDEKLAQLLKNYDPVAAEKGYVNIKAQGNQWNWTYTYQDMMDADGFALEFVSNPLHVGLSSDPAGSTAAPRMLAADYPMVVPVGRYIRYYTAASDVIHSWTVPAFGVKTDAIPGRLNEGWFLVNEEGTYYGQCSELCGVNHAYMPIEVRAVSQETYDRWAELMLAGDFEAANEVVGKSAQIASMDSDVQLASAPKN